MRIEAGSTALGTCTALIGLASIWIAGVLAEAIGIVLVLSLACSITSLAGVLGLMLLDRYRAPLTPDRRRYSARRRTDET